MKTAFIIIVLFCIPLNILASIRAVSVTLPDGELITYYQRGPLSAKETSIKGLPKDPLMVRQVTDGNKLVQAIYNEGRLLDCDLSSRKIEAEQLEVEINHMMSNINTTRNNNEHIIWPNNSEIFTNINNNNNSWKVPRRNLPWLNLNRLTRQCLSSHDRTISTIVNSRSRRSLLSVKPARHSRNRLEKSRRDHLAKGKKHRLKHKLITPGTKWCGPSNRAFKYQELGGFWQADKCCRRHDNCKLTIAPFSNDFSNVNTGPFTMSHCSCDRRFRNCLKMADTGASNLVGKLFFNVVQTKCFVLKAEKVCTKRSWWGKCQKHQYKKLAHIRNNLSY